jgi:glycosyltransferase involved in cell wall biosynthesis
MNVLFLSTQEGRDRSQSAYTHRLAKLCDTLKRKGIETDFIGLRDYSIGRPTLAQPFNIPFLWNKVSKCDVIHAAQDGAYTAGLWKPLINARIILDNHGDTFSEAQLDCLFNPGIQSTYWLIQAMIANAVAYRSADHFLIVSKPMEHWMTTKWKIPPSRMSLIRNGVDLSLFQPITTMPSHPFTICYAGGFDPWQGIGNIVRAVELLPTNNVRLKIIGFTPAQEAEKRRIAQRLGERVELVNRVSQAELINHLAAAHFLVIPRSSHPAMHVALPTKFAEYLALAKPVIVCDVDETAEMVRQHQCGLVSAPNPAALADIIQQASSLSTTEIRQMGERGRAFAEQAFSWDIIGEAYVQALNRMDSDHA